MEIDVKEESFEESFKGTDSIGVTFLFPPYFKDESILLTDNRVIVRRQDDTLY